MLRDLSNEVITFGEFRLDPRQRALTRAGEPVELGGRYLDALLLLASNPGELITKDRFLSQVWNGVPVTDEALTQAIRTIRRALGDEAGQARYIATVPKHGYRFVGEVAPIPSPFPGTLDNDAGAVPSRPALVGVSKESPLLLTAAGLVGGAAAGLIGGIGYGLLAASDPPAGTGAISVVLVLTCVCLAVGLLGGLGVGAGIAAACRFPGERLFPLMLGGAFGGLVVGALGRLVGLDAFALLVGSRPVAITGGSEGLLIGALAGAAAWLALRKPDASLARATATGAGLGAVAGLLITSSGGQMMAGSLTTLAAAHPDAPLGALLASAALPAWTEFLTSAIEGATFVGALSLAFAWVQRLGTSAH